MAKVNTSKGPDPKSKRSKRRANRGFVNTAVSTRKGRRADERSSIARNLGGKVLEPGQKADVKCGLSTWVHTAGGAIHHHKG